MHRHAIHHGRMRCARRGDCRRVAGVVSDRKSAVLGRHHGAEDSSISSVRPASNDTFHLPEPVTALALRAKGGLVLSLKKDFALFDLQSQQLTYLGDPEKDKPDNRFNDAKCDRRGRFWAGTMGNVHWDAPSGALYRLDPDGTITCHQTDVICANGMGWSPDNRVMYFTESFRYSVFAYDFDAAAGTLSNRRVFASLDPKSGGFPDGLTVDAEGHVWSVHNAIGKVVRYTPTGEIELTSRAPRAAPVRLHLRRREARHSVHHHGPRNAHPGANRKVSFVGQFVRGRSGSARDRRTTFRGLRKHTAGKA